MIRTASSPTCRGESQMLRKQKARIVREHYPSHEAVRLHQEFTSFPRNSQPSTRKQVTVLNPPPQTVLDQLPKLRSTEQVPAAEKWIHMHFFCGPCDWYVAEHKEHDGDHYFLGFVNLGDPNNAEWGTFTLSELQCGPVGITPIFDVEAMELMAEMPVFVEWDEYWQPKKFGEINGPWRTWT